MLKERILREIEKEQIKSGKMGTEPVTVSVHLTEEEKEEFLAMNEFDNEHYTWEFDDTFPMLCKLYITYTEEV